MLNWFKNLYIVKLLFGEPEKTQSTLVHSALVVKEKKKPGRRPGIKTRKTVKK